MDQIMVKGSLTNKGSPCRVSYRIFGLGGGGELFVHQQSAGLGAFLPRKKIEIWPHY